MSCDQRLCLQPNLWSCKHFTLVGKEGMPEVRSPALTPIWGLGSHTGILDKSVPRSQRVQIRAESERGRRQGLHPEAREVIPPRTPVRVEGTMGAKADPLLAWTQPRRKIWNQHPVLSPQHTVSTPYSQQTLSCHVARVL